MDVKQILQLLRTNSILCHLDEDHLQGLIASGSLQDMPKHKMIFYQGEQGDSVYFLLDGKVEVLKPTRIRDMSVAHLSPGDYFGEIAVLNAVPRTASIRTLQHCQVLKISKDNFMAFFDSLTLEQQALIRTESQVRQQKTFASLKQQNF